MNQILSVIWLGRMDLKTSILAQESVKSTYGIALCRGNYGVRVENACREQVRKSIGVKSLGYFSVEGIPKGSPSGQDNCELRNKRYCGEADQSN